ncbi:hypothetical protein [Tardiphaga sp.]|uniref:hypothetical protein n=1 Tax=Tardiphaga sp. TaxID=1926292 RepID=UPI00352AA7C8
MPRILFSSQEKGGVGKTLIVRALAEAVEGAPIIEIDASHRLLELEARVSFFQMRADREAIERTGGRAARAEFDAVLEALSKATLPTIVDVGANTSVSLFTMLADVAPELAAEFAVCVVVTNEPGAMVETPRLLALAKPWTAARFVVENRLHGNVDPKWLKAKAGDATVSSLEAQSLEDGAEGYLQAGGLAIVDQLNPNKLREAHGIGPGLRIRRDLAKFRLEAMRAVKPAAEWLVG